MGESKEPKPCKWCAQGIKLTGSDHWIVKSIVPARIDIKPCTAIVRTAQKEQAP